MSGLFTSAWRFRSYIAGAIANVFLARFSRSRLGAAWIILNPLAMVAIYALVLSSVLAARMQGIDTPFAYAIYLTAGIAAWALFTDILTRSLTLFIDNGNLLKKVVFPRISLPLIVAGVALIDNLLLLVAIFLIFGLIGHWPGAQIIWLPPLVLLTLGMALALGIILGCLNVFVRDIAQVVPIALQFGFWLTPIVYQAEILPPQLRVLLSYNPLFPLVTAYQDVLVFDRVPRLDLIVILALAVAALLGLALFTFRRASSEMVDVL
ncbi:ABC transporter permease [Thiocystis violacea]|uniref:ABC transporter permease n=1 Tax=Thiocystis violacea TaxID=13725 RepID=UPI00190671BA|nr:ABC transporter permease [Thiocystis violacea]MBK1719776.1 ABC transporter [Thiocystis violacea]